MSGRTNEELAALVRTGDADALGELVENNMPLVRAMARRFACGSEKGDLVQAGAVGLIRAARGFDPKRGTRLTTYAVPFIGGEMRRCLKQIGRLPAPGDTLYNEEDWEQGAVDRIFVSELLLTLESGERELVSLRFFSGLTQKETGVMLGVSQPQVSRRERKILGKLRKQNIF